MLDIVTVRMGICYRCKSCVSYLWPSDVCMCCVSVLVLCPLLIAISDNTKFVLPSLG